MKININAQNPLELKEQLEKLSVAVPPRSNGRTKRHTENWIGRRLLMALSKIGILDFPMVVLHMDSPDLRITTPKESIGLELSEAVPETYARAVAIRNRDYPNAPVDRFHFSGKKDFPSKYIHNYLGGTPTETVWLGNSVEQDWADLVNDSISQKTNKLNKTGFELFSRNWLGLYTSSTGPLLNIRNACPLLKKPSTFSGEHKFDTVFVLTGNELVVITDSDIDIEDQFEI